MAAIEPSLAALPHPLARYALATRPAFLTVTLGGCLIGLATAALEGSRVDGITALVTVVFALVAHGAANVLNDYYDALNGTDAANVDRLYPFTGGSRFIQNGVLTEAQMLVYGVWLVVSTIAAGLWLVTVSGPALLAIGAAGLFVGWAYSAPPLRLNSRGWGEVCIWASWMIVAAGADYVQRGTLDATPWIASAGYALLVTNILFINQFPDRRADESVGKRHWVVRLGPARAKTMYGAIALAAHGCVVAAVALGSLPVVALAALLSLPLSLKAWADLRRYAEDVKHLTPAIQATITATLAHGVVLSGALAASRLL